MDKIQKLKVVMASTYAMLLRTQNFHWHVRSSNFLELHELFEAQYRVLFEHVDELAERIVMLNEVAPHSFDEFSVLSDLDCGKSTLAAPEMIESLVQGYTTLDKKLKELNTISEKSGDLVTSDLLVRHIVAYEKSVWMLQSHIR